MTVVDVPVDTCQKTIGGCLHIIALPGSCGKSIGGLQIVGESFEFAECGTAVGDGPGRCTVTCTGIRPGGDVIVDFCIDEEEELVAQDRTTEGESVGIGMPVIYGKVGITHAGSLQRGTGEIGIEGTPELVGSALGDSIDTTTGETALTHVIRRDGDGHLFEGIK